MLRQALVATLVLLLPRLLDAQERPGAAAADSVRNLDLPGEVADAVIEAFNDPARLRLTGERVARQAFRKTPGAARWNHEARIDHAQRLEKPPFEECAQRLAGGAQRHCLRQGRWV